MISRASRYLRYSTCSSSASAPPARGYDTSDVSHVGIYVGDGMMLHCGDVRPDRTKVEVDERRTGEGMSALPE